MSKAKKAGLLSALFMGAGQIIINKEYIKGAFFALIEIIFLLNIQSVIKNLRGLITLGEVTGYTQANIRFNDHSIFMMIDGIIMLIIVTITLCLYLVNIRDGIVQGKKLDAGLKHTNFKKYIKEFGNKITPFMMLAPGIIGILFFVLIPILFGMLIAFTNYSAPNHTPPNTLVDWVGLQNVKDMIRLSMWNETFVGVFRWTVILAFCTTFLNFAVGMFVAILINSREVKYKKFWRTIYILPYAIPQLISLLIFRNLLNGQFGPINLILRELGIINTYFGVFNTNIGWLSDPNLAKVTIIIVNLWLGFPYFMALLTGIMTSIPDILYEAARIDGANRFQCFKKITLPMVITATTPLIIMSFAHNFNNFGIVYFLTSGGPGGTYDTGSGAGSTDILISWIYKLTVDNQYYNIAALMSLLIFLIIGAFSAYNFSRTKAFNDTDF